MKKFKASYNMMYTSKHLIVINDFGVLKKGMRCYCLYETKEFVYLYFEYPVVGDINEIKISKNNLTNFEIML